MKNDSGRPKRSRLRYDDCTREEKNQKRMKARLTRKGLLLRTSEIRYIDMWMVGRQLCGATASVRHSVHDLL